MAGLHAVVEHNQVLVAVEQVPNVVRRNRLAIDHHDLYQVKVPMRPGLSA